MAIATGPHERGDELGLYELIGHNWNCITELVDCQALPDATDLWGSRCWPFYLERYVPSQDARRERRWFHATTVVSYSVFDQGYVCHPSELFGKSQRTDVSRRLSSNMAVTCEYEEVSDDGDAGHINRRIGTHARPKTLKRPTGQRAECGPHPADLSRWDSRVVDGLLGGNGGAL